MEKKLIYKKPLACVSELVSEPLLNTSWTDGETQKPVIEGDPDDIDSKKFNFGAKSPWESNR